MATLEDARKAINKEVAAVSAKRRASLQKQMQKINTQITNAQNRVKDLQLKKQLISKEMSE